MLADEEVDIVRRLCVLLRLAVVLHRSRVDFELPNMQLEADGDTLRLHFPDDWLDAHPLTAADLEVEADYLRAADIKFKYR
jgi:exopolyphosphatase/guanosine-5'-triphosphate,3'-diphosphate pyrophosphatase